MNLMHGSISYVFSISAPAIMATLLIFGVIHLLLLLRAAVAVGRSSAIQLLQSEAAGEKPPRANWFWDCWALSCWEWPTTWQSPSRSR